MSKLGDQMESSGELLKAFKARLEVIEDCLAHGKTQAAHDYLKRLMMQMPDPEPRHRLAAQGICVKGA